MKTALITGASSTIGDAIVHALYTDYKIIACSNLSTPPVIRDGVEYYKRFSLRDVDSSPLKRILDDHTIEVLINAAGVSIPGELKDYHRASWNETFDVNLVETFYLTQRVAAHMIENKLGGEIINIASFAATLPARNNAVYAASKAALVSLTMSMADEWGQYDIRVNSVSPGTVPSPMTEDHIETNKPEILESIAMRRLGNPTEVATLVRFLVEKNTYITGGDIKVTGGKFLTQNIGKRECSQ